MRVSIFKTQRDETPADVLEEKASRDQSKNFISKEKLLQGQSKQPQTQKTLWEINMGIKASLTQGIFNWHGCFPSQFKITTG